MTTTRTQWDAAAEAVLAERTFAPLAVGDRVWVLVTRKSGEERRTILGTADARIAEILPDGRFVVVPIRASSGVLAGHPHTAQRCELYARKAPDEHALFGKVITFFWGRPDR